ncbi:WGR domain-containing protein [Chitinophaga sp. YR573]|uniref:leucine-rich repeat domain-containing protein n=1 Tax=Chitinophaga sp. YR573 TaxID=1881040 RepID=UPI0008C03788|nr:WGR domain-containing protein [Chitinophaga sp. YR573]SEW34561.1 WGR domain-containing protein [Chitinophaga sp. YR573]
MIQYFELQDDTSSKFWEITLENNIVKTRYGKIGTDGKSTEKEFGDAAAAGKEYDKLVKEKTKKGYTEVVPLVYPAYTLITEKEAKKRFSFSKYIEGGYGNECNYILLEGEVVLDGDLDMDRFCTPLDTYGIIVDGNLTVNGVIFQPDMDSGQALFVTGNVRAKSINKGGAEFYIKGNLSIEQTIYGYYNHGSLKVEGNTEATTIFSEDHYFQFKGDVQGLIINTGEIQGAEADFETTEPLVDELINNEDYSYSEITSDYINSGRHIIKDKYLPAVSETVVNKTSAVAQLITEDEAKEKFDLSLYDSFDEMGFQKVIFLDGDVYIDGDLNHDWTVNTLEALGEDPDTSDSLLLINGNLTVAGTIEPANDNYPFLLVQGNVKCDVLHSYDEFIHITGDADIKYALNGNYNHGRIEIEGKTKTPYILNSDHNSLLRPEGATVINYYGDHDDFFEYDYTVKDFEEVMVSAVYNEKGAFAVRNFIALVKAGKSPLKKGARPARLILEEELAQLGSKKEDIEELDLTGRKLKEFPRILRKALSLKKLVLDDNPIKSIPFSIGELSNLEELHLQKCGLERLPYEIAKLKKLRVLDVAGNWNLKLPPNINEVASLRVLDISYNKGFGFPASVEGLKELEELSCADCSGPAPIDFPIEITQLTGLKRLFMGTVSIKTIPDSFLQLEKLEELDLDASLCYLNELPDLSKLKNLKILHGDGLISTTTRPCPKQSLLKSFFNITSLEELYIDRHGEREEAFITKEQFEEMRNNLAHDPERVKAFEAAVNEVVPNSIYGDGRKGIVREALKAAHLEGISNLKNLRVLDLSFNDLASLPEEIHTMTHLQFLNLRYNRLPTAERLKLNRSLPGCTIDFRDNRPENDTVDTEDVKQWQAMNTLMKEANALMYAKDDVEKLRASLGVYDQVFDFFSSGKVVDEYNLLYANYGKMYAYSYLNSYHKAAYSKEGLLEMNLAAIQQGLKTLALIPSVIWHFTDMGAFHEEVTRVVANAVAWQMYEIYDKKKDLEKALEIIAKAVGFVSTEYHYFIYDTQVRILLKMGQKEEAYKIVKRTLALASDFEDFSDFKNDADYKEWLVNQN